MTRDKLITLVLFAFGIGACGSEAKPNNGDLSVLAGGLRGGDNQGDADGVSDDDSQNETEGVVASIDTEGFVVLLDGTVIDVSEAEIDPTGDRLSLLAAETALADGFVVEAEATGSFVGENFVADRIKLEYEGPDDSSDDRPDMGEVEGAVAAVDLSDETLTLADGTLVRTSINTIIDPLGDVMSLEAAAAALDSGAALRAEAHGEFDLDGSFIADSLELEIDN